VEVPWEGDVEMKSSEHPLLNEAKTMKNCLLLTNLAPGVTRMDLSMFFGKFGAVK